MRIPKNLYDDNQLKVLSRNGVIFDFDKDYSEDEIADIEERIGNIVLDHCYSKGIDFYENLIDIFVNLQEGILRMPENSE